HFYSRQVRYSVFVSFWIGIRGAVITGGGERREVLVFLPAPPAGLGFVWIDSRNPDLVGRYSAELRARRGAAATAEEAKADDAALVGGRNFRSADSGYDRILRRVSLRFSH